MPLSDTVSDWIDAYVRSGHVPVQIDEDIYNRIQENKPEGKMLRVRPFPENGGISASEQLLQALHDLRTKFSLINISDRFAFELWFNEGAIQFIFYVEDDQHEEKLRRQIDAHYPNSEIVEMDTTFPQIYQNDWIAGAELYLKQSKYYPIRNPRGVRDLKSDPYRSITSDMLGGDNDRIIIQFVVRPAMGTWTHGGTLGYINPLSEDIEEVADELKQSKLIPDARGKERSATSEERQLAENIARQDGLPAYDVNIRILALSPDKTTAKSQAWSIGRTFEQSFQEAGDQQFLQDETGGIELKELIERTAAREFMKNGITLTIPEAATVAHIPNESIETPSVDWNNTQASARIPASAEKFEEEVETFEGFDQQDDDPEAAVPAEDEPAFAEEDDPFMDDQPPQQPNDQNPPEHQQPPGQQQQQAPPGQHRDQQQQTQQPVKNDPSTPGFDNTQTNSDSSGLLGSITEYFGFENDRGFQTDEATDTEQPPSDDDDGLPLEEAPDPLDEPRERQEPRQDDYQQQQHQGQQQTHPEEQHQQTGPSYPDRPNQQRNTQQQGRRQEGQQRGHQPSQQHDQQPQHQPSSQPASQSADQPEEQTTTNDNWEEDTWADDDGWDDGWEFDDEDDETDDWDDDWDDE